MIAIAHRLSTIAAMDRLVVIDERPHRRGGHARRAGRKRRPLRPALGAPVGRLPARRRGTGTFGFQGNCSRMSDGDFREKLWGRFEGAIDAFQDTDREVLPDTAWQFILYFANQARGPFLLLLLVGGLAGAVDASLYWSVGWLIDLLDNSTPRPAVRRTTGRELAGTARAASCRANADHDRLGRGRAAGHRAGLLLDGALAVVPPGDRAALRLLPERLRRPHRHQDHAGRRGGGRLHRQRAADHVVVRDLHAAGDHDPDRGRSAGWGSWWRCGSSATPASSGSCCRRCAGPGGRPPTSARSSTAGWSTPSPTSCR